MGVPAEGADRANHFQSRDKLLEFARRRIARARYAEARAEEMACPPPITHARIGACGRHAAWSSIPAFMFGCTREQAIAFTPESARLPPDAAAATVDRIAVWPRQFTAYDTGALEFFALRDEAKQALGDRFDLREFHEVLLGNEAVTLSMLREQIRTRLSRRSR